MPLSELNHYFVRANDLKATRNFYVDVLGFEEMPRPDFPFPGYWLGVGGKIQVHMAPHNIPDKEKYYLGTRKNAATDQTGVVDHIAFLATDPQEFVARFQQRGLEFRPRYLPDSQLYQLMIRDPDGLMIELNFFGITDAPEWGGEDYAQMARVEEQA